MTDKENWNGEGLPPVGTECEYVKTGSAEQMWWPCRIIAYDRGVPVIKTRACNYHARPFSKYKFRPLKSDREREIEEMVEVMDDWDRAGRPLAVALYDAGYRKTEES